MPNQGQYTDSESNFKTNLPKTWKPVSAVASALVLAAEKRAGAK